MSTEKKYIPIINESNGDITIITKVNNGVHFDTISLFNNLDDGDYKRKRETAAVSYAVGIEIYKFLKYNCPGYMTKNFKLLECI